MADRPLRVLHIASTSAIGGAEQMILQLLRYADPSRVQPDVLTLMGPGHLTLLAMQAGVQGTNWALDRLSDPRLLRRMRRFLEAGHYDIVHTYGLRAELLTRWVAYGLRVPVISGLHSIDPWRRWPHVWLDRLTADGVTAWVAVAEAVKRSRVEREKFPPHRIHVVYNGIPDRAPPDAEARAKARRRLKLDPAAPVLAVVANLREAKGYPDLIEAVAGLRRERPDLVCLCAGRDDSDGMIPAMAEARGLGGAMRWLGYVNDTDELLAAADVAVLASHWEGCPVNVIEAMRAGRPTVATAVGGIPELIEHGRHGLLVPPRDPAALQAAIEKVLADPAAAATLGAAARQRFLEQFTIGRMVDELTRIYER